jgi:hypothetical protein
MTYSKTYGFGASARFSRLFIPFGGSGGGGGPWTPENLADMTSWYDGADLGTMTQAIEGQVNIWADKSSNANTMTQNGVSKMPLVGSDINGTHCLDFNADDYMEATNQNVAGRPSGQAVSHACLYAAHDGAGAARVIDGIGDLLIVGPWAGFHQAHTGVSFIQGPSTVSTPIACAIYSKPSGTLTTLWINGVAATPSKNTSNFSTGYDIGDSGNPVNSRLGEVLSWNSDDDETRQKVEGYLCWKFGIQDTLPGGHPYKDAPPTA